MMNLFEIVAQVKAAHTLQTLNLRHGVLKGRDSSEYGDALEQAIEHGMVVLVDGNPTVSKRGLILISVGG